jgi:hypothetical protein
MIEDTGPTGTSTTPLQTTSVKTNESVSSITPSDTKEIPSSTNVQKKVSRAKAENKVKENKEHKTRTDKESTRKRSASEAPSTTKQNNPTDLKKGSGKIKIKVSSKSKHNRKKQTTSSSSTPQHLPEDKGIQNESGMSLSIL